MAVPFVFQPSCVRIRGTQVLAGLSHTCMALVGPDLSDPLPLHTRCTFHAKNWVAVLAGFLILVFGA